MTQILAIDPGPTQSAYVVYDEYPDAFGIVPNEEMLREIIPQHTGRRLAIEMVASYGMAVGREVFETCVWAGRFLQAHGGIPILVYRKDVKMHLCHSMRAKDANIRQALIDRFGAPGTKKSPGVTYGISRDVWAALAVAVFAADSLDS